MKHSQQFLFTLIFILTSFATYSQKPLIKQYSMKDGLPSATIFPMIQDKDGFIWFGTDVGVTRFDGIRFQNYSLNDGLSDNFILAVATDSKGRIWFLGYNGTVSYWLNGKIYNSESDTLLRKIKSQNSFIDFFEDSEHQLWFISLYQYLVVESPDLKHLVNSDIGNSCVVLNGNHQQVIMKHDIQSSSIEIYKKGNRSSINSRYHLRGQSGYWRSSDGSILFASKEGIIRQVDTSQQLLFNLIDELKETRLVDIMMTKDSLVFVSTLTKGVYCWDLKSLNGTPKIYLANKKTIGLLNDTEGNIWVSTLNDGLYMIPFLGNRVEVYDKDILKEDQINSIGKLGNGELLIGLNNGKLLFFRDSIIKELKTLYSASSNDIIRNVKIKGDDIWIASDNGLIHKNAKTGCDHYILQHDDELPIRRINNIKDLYLGKESIFIATGYAIWEYPLNCNSTSFHIAKNIRKTQEKIRLYSIYLDWNNTIWYGTINGLISKHEDIEVNYSKVDAVLAQRINCISSLSDSTLLLATHGFGLVFYKNGKIIYHITKLDGLCDDICRKITILNEKIFIASPSGVSVITYANGKIQNIQNLNTGNFLSSNNVNDIYVDDTCIAIATMEGVVMLGNWALEKPISTQPILRFRQIKAKDSLLQVDKLAILNYQNNSIKFDFIGIYYQQPEAVNYRYKLKNEQEWQLTKYSILEFPFLEPGKYNLQIQARINQGEWSSSLNYDFIITPPFWDTNWFKAIVIILLLIIIYVIINRRQNNYRKEQEAKNKIEKQIALLEQQALQTMMNPHFIFNVMNSIQHFINSDNKEAANNYLVDFATLIRLNLSLSYQRFIPLEDELSYLELYLKFEKLRIGDQFTYEIIVDPAIDTLETTIAVMMIQPFIENAVWHGIMPLGSEGHLSIAFKKAGVNLLQVIITDNGIGIADKYIDHEFVETRTGIHALYMTQQRLKLLGKSSEQELYLRFSHIAPTELRKGTKVELMISTD